MTCHRRKASRNRTERRSRLGTTSQRKAKSWAEGLVDRLQDSVDVVKKEVRKDVTEGVELAVE